MERRTRLGRFRCLAICYEWLEALHRALLDLGCALTCRNVLHWPSEGS